MKENSFQICIKMRVILLMSMKKVRSQVILRLASVNLKALFFI